MTALSDKPTQSPSGKGTLLKEVLTGRALRKMLTADEPLQPVVLRRSAGAAACGLLLVLALTNPGGDAARLNGAGDSLQVLVPSSESTIEVARYVRSRFDTAAGMEKLAVGGTTPADLSEELHCLALNIYHEARGEGPKGKIAVGHVTINRLASERFPGSICGVVQQGIADKLHHCQFSWFCDGQSDDVTEAQAWQDSIKIARDVYWGHSEDPTEGALWYHADYVSPEWRNAFERGPTIGRHIFYRLPLPTDSQYAGDPNNTL